MSSADRPESYIFANTSFASELLIVPLSTSANQPRQRARRQRHVGDARATLLERPQQLAHHPVAGRLGIAGLGGDLLEVVRQLGGLRQHARVVVGQAVRGDEPLSARLGQLRQRLRARPRLRAASTTSGGRSGSGKYR